MRSIPQYHFHRTKYGDELLIDVVELRSIERYIRRDPIHLLSYYDITFITEGSSEFIINNHPYPVWANTVISSIPGEIRSWKPQKQLTGYALIFEEEFLLSFFNDPYFLQSLPFLHPDRKLPSFQIDSELGTRISHLILHIKKEITRYQQKDSHILRAMLYEALMLLNRAYIELDIVENVDRTPVNRHLTMFIKLVNEDFRTNRSIQFYAGKLCITANYLNEIVQKSIGINAKTYIRNKVLQEAKRLLTYTTLSISEIAEQLNYTTSSYFVRSFHQYTGLTPKQYREQPKP